MSETIQSLIRRQPCGTYGGYQRHKRNGETPCEPCREARNQYRRRYYSEKGNREAAANSARQRAASELTRRHRDEYRQLVVRFANEETA